MNYAELNEQWKADGYTTHPVDAIVFRSTGGPLMTGKVTAPTDADVERCSFIHGAPGRRDPMVLVRWGFNRTWEYTRNLQVIDPGPSLAGNAAAETNPDRSNYGMDGS